MDTALDVHRFHFAFTIVYHYLFPQLTMGLGLLIVSLKVAGLRTGNEHYHACARFWAKIFALNFAMGVVTGIPMEFQFGTNWSAFSRAAGGVIGQTLAMEGMFSFFLESSFLGMFLFGEKRLGPKWHTVVGFLVFLGSWLSGYFIVATNAWMQHPVGYRVEEGRIVLTSLGALLMVFLCATVVAGKLLDVDPFGQPGVEAAKAATRNLLAEPGGETDAEVARLLGEGGGVRCP